MIHDSMIPQFLLERIGALVLETSNISLFSKKKNQHLTLEKNHQEHQLSLKESVVQQRKTSEVGVIKY